MLGDTGRVQHAPRRDHRGCQHTGRGGASFPDLVALVLLPRPRRRRHELAVLRALGLTRRQSRLVILTQATLLAVIGLAFGIPLGIALGRTLWRAATGMLPLAYQPPLAPWALLLIAPVALVVANLLATWPALRAARLRPGQILRTE